MIGFEKFVGYKVLDLFLFSPSSSFNINEAAEKTGISTGSAKHYCDEYLKEKLLCLEKIRNQNRFSLNNLSPYVRELKKTFALLHFRECGLDGIAIPPALIAVYGSFANGTFLGNSDLDLLVVGDKTEINQQQLSKFRDAIKYELQLISYSLPKWEAMKKAKHPFAEAILRKHILIKGETL
jgi:hypothetical protein